MWPFFFGSEVCQAAREVMLRIVKFALQVMYLRKWVAHFASLRSNFTPSQRSCFTKKSQITGPLQDIRKDVFSFYIPKSGLRIFYHLPNISWHLWCNYDIEPEYLREAQPETDSYENLGSMSIVGVEPKRNNYESCRSESSGTFIMYYRKESFF